MAEQKIRVISSRNEIEKLNEDETAVHISFRPSGKDLLNVLDRCKGIKLIQCPKSYSNTISKTFKCMLELQGVELVEGDVWGHRSDIDVYATIGEDDDGQTGETVN